VNYETDRKILADVDGVLLDWKSGFDAWMSERGYEIVAPSQYKQSIRYGIEQYTADKLVEQFNESAWMGFLKPLRDSVDVLFELNSAGWHIECITSLSTDHWAGELRRMNLERFFGRGVIRRVICLPTGADKDDALSKYKNTHWWIEDKPANCEAGLRAGLRPILMSHDYNQNYKNNDVVRVDDWKQIFDLVTG